MEKTGNKYLDGLALESLKPELSSRAINKRIDALESAAELKAKHIASIGYRPKKESWSEEACCARELGVLRQLETTASQSIPGLVCEKTKRGMKYFKSTHKMVIV